MEFAFSEEQQEFRSALRAYAEKECTVADLRSAWASDIGWSAPRWSALAEMGVVGLTVPEAFGGMGLDELWLAGLLEEAGRAGLPEPLLETTALGVPLLVEARGSLAEELRQRFLPRVVAGEAVLTVGVSSMPAVPVAAAADLLLLEDKGTLHALDASAVEVHPRRALDGARRPGTVSWQPSEATLLARGQEAAVLLSRLQDRAALSSAAILLGVADQMITIAAQYTGQREQFGRPIGSFQAVKHHLANALVRLEFARPVVYRAAWSFAHGLSHASRDASAGKAQASDAATFAARVALQVHGAIGYTWEHDLHLWAKRAWSLAAAWGDARTHRARVLESLLDALPDREGR
jgi:hypothetical protein